MNPYSILRRLGAFNAVDAVLITPEGEFPVKIKPEQAKTDGIAGAFDGLAPVRVWSCDADVELAAGMALAVDGDVFPLVRGDGGEFWTWLYDRAGTRKIFFTRAKNVR